MLKEKISEIIKKDGFVKKLLFFLAILLIFLQIYLTKQINLPNFIGEANVSIFDIWSIQHLIVGFFLGLAVITYWPKMASNWKKMVITMILIAVSWEIIELLLEYGKVNIIMAQWNEHENWANRIIGDPVMNTMGGLIIYGMNNLIK